MANQIITRIQVEGNDVVSFLNGATPPYLYVRGMSQIMPQIPTYISYRYDSITISQVAGEAFSFTVYTITDVGGNAFTTLNFQDPADVVQAKTIEIYRLLVTAVFKGCCECGNTEPDCSIQYTAGNGTDAGTVLFDSGAMRVNYFTANNQDFTGFWPIIQDGSWIFVFSKTDPTVYGVFQLSGYTDGGPGVYAQFVATLLTGPGEFPDGTELCLDVTSVGGSLVQDWQDTLDIGSVLDKDNTVDGAGFNFVFDNNDSFTINSAGGSVEVDATGSSLNAGSQQVLVTSGYIDVITPLYGSATTGMVLALNASGHVEYTLAGTGTLSSIGLFMPPAFTVSAPNPLITDGSFTVTVGGTDLDYIDGEGNLATLPVYTAVSGLHTQESPVDPFVFHLGGILLENALVTTTQGLNEWQFGVGGLAGQDNQFPLGVSNLGNGGVATFQDYGSGARTNPSVEIVGDADLIQPLLELRMEGVFSSLNDTYLRLKYEGTPSLASSSIDFQFRNNNAVPANSVFVSGRLTNTLTNFTDNSEQSKFELELIDAGTLANKLEVLGTGQLILNEYGAATFINTAPTYGLVVDSSGQVWKKLVAGGGTVTSVGGAGLITTTATNPFTTSGTVTTSVNENRLVGRWDAAGTGIMQEITIGTNLDLTAAGVLNASGGGFDVQVNTTTIIPPSTILNLKNGTDITVVNEGSGNVRFDWTGSAPSQGLQDVIIVDNTLTQDNTIQGTVTSFRWKNNSFYEINPVTTYDPGTGPLFGYFKAYVGKYPPSYSELYVEAIYAQMKSIGTTTQVVKVDTTGVYIQTPALGSASNGYVLTLVDQATGKADWQLGGGSSPLTTKGDVYTFDTADARLPVGTDGYILSADSSTATGLNWVFPTGGVPTTRLVSTTAPLSGGGDLSADLTLSIPAATTSVDGYLTSGDFTNFNTAYTNRITNLTTTGSGAATLISNTLNIPTPTLTSPLTTKGDLYTFDTADTRLPVGLDTQVLLADSSTATGLKWGTNTTPPASGYYGAFQDSTTQTAASANTAYPVKFNTIDLTNGVSVVNDGSSNPTQITLANTGIYNIQFSLQLEKTGGSGNFTIDMWLRKNGVDIPDTTGKVVLTGAVNASPIVAAWNYLLDLAAGDYVQLMWSTTNNNAVILAAAATPPHPGIPSAILTVTQQAGILAGTGITAINSLTGAAQTLTTGTTGTDFAIVDSGVDHKFNLPIASAVNTGKLSATDWNTFNNKAASDLPEISITTSNAREDDYAPTGWPGTSDRVKVIRINSTNSNSMMSLGGLSNPVAGRMVTIYNASTANNLIIIENIQPLSAAANRFRMTSGLPYFLLPNRSVTFLYDGTYWTQLSSAPFGGLDFFEDFLQGLSSVTGSNTGLTSSVTTGAGSGLGSVAGVSGVDEWGVTSLNTGTTATGACGITMNNRRAGGNDGFGASPSTNSIPYVTVSKFGFPTLATAAQDYNGYMGLSARTPIGLVAPNISTTDTGYYWRYPGFGSSFWNVVTKTTAGVAVTTVTSIPITVNNIWLGIYKVGGSTIRDAVFFYSNDGVTYQSGFKFVGATSSIGGFPTMAIGSTVGTTSKELKVDWLGVAFNLAR